MLVQEPLIDHDQIDLLREALGEDELRALYSDFASSAAGSLEAITRALELGELADVRKAAHLLKGLSGGFGAARVAALARHIELVADSLETIKQHLPCLVETIEQTNSTLAREHG